MQSKLKPAVAFAAIAFVLVALGTALYLFAGRSGSDGKPVVVAAPDPNDLRFRPDPRLAGGGGG